VDAVAVAGAGAGADDADADADAAALLVLSYFNTLGSILAVSQACSCLFFCSIN
jgi:hypothetical protein